MSTGLFNLGYYLSGPAQDLSLFILQFIIRTCTCRPGIVSQYMYLTDSIEIKLNMCHYYEHQPTNKTHTCTCTCNGYDIVLYMYKFLRNET